jgi:hypothetical protein
MIYRCDCRDMNLRFTEEFALLPVEVTVDVAAQQK